MRSHIDGVYNRNHVNLVVGIKASLKLVSVKSFCFFSSYFFLGGVFHCLLWATLKLTVYLIGILIDPLLYESLPDYALNYLRESMFPDVFGAICDADLEVESVYLIAILIDPLLWESLQDYTLNYLIVHVSWCSFSDVLVQCVMLFLSWFYLRTFNVSTILLIWTWQSGDT